MIGIVARLMALPGMLIMELRVLQTAEAAMEAVPRVLIRWLTSSLLEHAVFDAGRKSDGQDPVGDGKIRL